MQMLMPTREQRVWILVHAAWDLVDDGFADATIVQRLADQGAPVEIAKEALRLAREEQGKSLHTDRQRQQLVGELNRKVTGEDYAGIRQVLMKSLGDKRTLYKAYSTLSSLLLSEVHAQGTAAAFGLSFLLGYGDWPLIQAMSHDNEWVRYRSAFALGKMGANARHAIHVLREALNDPDEWVRDAVSEAIGAIEKDPG
jgi:hypothetical protein